MICCLVLGHSLVGGCSRGPKPAQLSGKVIFKGQPVPAGYISFAPDVAKENRGQLRVLQIKDGVYDSATEVPPGINPGAYQVRIAGFDGKSVLSAGALAKYTERGTVLGFDLVGGKPKLLVHLARAKRQNVELSSAVLKLMRVIE